jgi:hypothetical protein
LSLRFFSISCFILTHIIPGKTSYALNILLSTYASYAKGHETSKIDVKNNQNDTHTGCVKDKKIVMIIVNRDNIPRPHAI